MPDSPATSRGWGPLLFSAPFGPYFWGKILWTVGIWVHSVVVAILAFEITESALFVGAVTAAQFLPQLLFTPIAGATADRGNVKRQIVAGRILSAVGSVGLAVGVFLVDEVHPAAILLSSLCVGLGLVTGGPAIQSIVPSLVRPEELADAVALNSMPLLVARAAAPAIGAIIYSTLGVGPALLVAGAGSLSFAAAMWLIKVPDPTPSADGDSSIRAGWQFVRRNRVVATLLLGVTAVGFGADPSMTLTPSIADDLGGGAALVGWLGSVFGVGSALGFAFLRLLRSRLHDHGLAPLGLATMAASLVLLAVSSTTWLAMAGFALGGVGMTLSLTSLTTLLHEACPDHVRGRVMAYWLMGFIGSRPLAGALDGLLADYVSVEAALSAIAAITAVGAVLCRPSRIRAGAAVGQPATAAEAAANPAR
ncbi:MFS transporter [Nocardioides sp. JQ2195]|uniref:MFS transporter n=1 Tax=Nocardioides sp. JQ2195 TaxID=2592334 RepID=UPI00143E72FD|nr:MFS transporter [Nocardioides sp. JQ2195]QIX25535.1 MFS transporter [Nocardioides sp. JQ2195]